MFDKSLYDATDPDLVAAETAAGAELAAGVGTLDDPRAKADPQAAALAAWSLVHGFSLLWLNEAVDNDDRSDRPPSSGWPDAVRNVATGSVRAMTDTPLTDIALTTLDGKPTTLAELADGAVLVVNVASKCGLTPQYSALEKLAQDYGDRGLTVIGVPCNQFMGQEPGTAEEIQTFCSATYGVTFPLLAKTDVNGAGPAPAVRRADQDRRRRRRGGRRAVELREVPARARWRGGQAVPAAHRTRRPRGGRGHRGGPAAIAAIVNCCQSVGNRCDTWRCHTAGVAGQLIVSISGHQRADAAPTSRRSAHNSTSAAVPASFLVAPRLKGGYRLDRDASTVEWLAARRDRGDAIVLHGFDEAATKKRRGEFATLPAHEANLRLMGADRVLEHLGLRTRLFAAPGWTVSQGTVTRCRATGSGCWPD